MGIFVKRTVFSKLVSLAATAGLLAAPGGVVAQSAPSAGNPLGIPDNVTLLGTANPNVRTATAVVNGDVITGTDIDHRVALLTNASSNELGPEELQQIRMQVLRNLIDETLQIQEAELQEIEVTRAEVNQTYGQIAAENFGQNPDAMDAYLISIGSSPVSLKRQIQGEMAWQRLLRRNVTPFVNVSDEEAREVLARLEASRGTEEFRIGEIYLSATPESRAAVEQNAQRIVEQLQQGGSFVAYARQFSEASTAPVGGDLGWVKLERLPGELASVAASMQPGQLVGPIPIPGGFSIMYMIDRRKILTADPRDAVLSLKQISISFAPGVDEATVNARAQQFAQAIPTIRGCGDAESVAATIGADVVTNDQIRARSLPDALQSTVLGLQVGQATPPFGSVADGIRVLMLCGRDDPQVDTGPTLEKVRDDLEDKRVGQRAQRYLRDLRNDAYITYN